MFWGWRTWTQFSLNCTEVRISFCIFHRVYKAFTQVRGTEDWPPTSIGSYGSHKLILAVFTKWNWLSIKMHNCKHQPENITISISVSTLRLRRSGTPQVESNFFLVQFAMLNNISNMSLNFEHGSASYFRPHTWYFKAHIIITEAVYYTYKSSNMQAFCSLVLLCEIWVAGHNTTV